METAERRGVTYANEVLSRRKDVETVAQTNLLPLVDLFGTFVVLILSVDNCRGFSFSEFIFLAVLTSSKKVLEA